MATRALEATVLWGDTVLDRIHLFVDRALRIRELQADVDLSPRLVIAEKYGAAALIRIPESALAHVSAGDLIEPVLEATVPLEDDHAVVFTLCNVSFVFRMVPPL